MHLRSRTSPHVILSFSKTHVGLFSCAWSILFCVTLIIRNGNNMELMFSLYIMNTIFITEGYSVEFQLLKLSELSCSECSICLGLAVSHLQMFFYWSLLQSVFLLQSEWELAAPMYLSTQCSSSPIGLI